MIATGKWSCQPQRNRARTFFATCEQTHSLDTAEGSVCLFSSPSAVPQEDLKTEERAKGIEPSRPAWKAGALPLSYARVTLRNRPEPSTLVRSGSTLIFRPRQRLARFLRQLGVSVKSSCSGQSSEISMTQITRHQFTQPDGTACGVRGSRRAASLHDAQHRHSTQWGKQDSNLRRQSHQIYSLAHLATLEFPPAQLNLSSQVFNSGSQLNSTADMAGWPLLSSHSRSGDQQPMKPSEFPGVHCTNSG